MRRKHRKNRNLAFLTGPHAALARACQLKGSQKALCNAIGVPQATIWGWLYLREKGTAAEYVAAIERETGVPRWELRPDIFPPPEHCRPLPEPAEAA